MPILSGKGSPKYCRAENKNTIIEFNRAMRTVNILPPKLKYILFKKTLGKEYIEGEEDKIFLVHYDHITHKLRGG